MAIRRCPYCKAIIDESQKYCNNCGTQLLFPDEEAAEEDLKGEKIVDEDFAPSPEEDFEASLEPPVEPEAEAGPEEINLEDVLQGDGAFPGEKSGELSAGRDDEIEEAGSAALEEGIVKSAEELLGAVPEPDLDLREKEESEEEADEGKSAADGLDFDAKGEIVQLMAELEKRKAAQVGESGELESSEVGAEGLPPWAELVKESPPDASAKAPGGKAEAVEGEGGADAPGSQGFAPGDTTDFRSDVMKRAERDRRASSTMGIPESVTKMREEAAIENQPYVLGDEGEDEEEMAAKVGAVDAESGEESETEEGPAEAVQPSLAEVEKLGFFGTIKAFLFDAAFVAVLWLIAAAFAAGMMKVGLVRLVREAPLSFGLLFLALFAGYFFLFLFFLGETLGRRLAAPKD